MRRQANKRQQDEPEKKTRDEEVQDLLLNQPSWVKQTAQLCKRLQRSAEKERSRWFKDVKLAYAFDQGDRSKIFGSDNRTSYGEAEPGDRAEYHLPLTSMRGDAFVAAVAGGGIEFKYRPKIDQNTLQQSGETIDSLSRMGNAAFEAYRNIIGFPDHFHKMVREMYIFDHAYGGPCIDYQTNYPDKIAGFRRFNALQCYNTSGYAWDEAPERVIEYFVNKEVLKAQYPEHADAIEYLQGGGSRAEGDGSEGTSQHTVLRDTWNLSSFSPDISEASPHDVMVREVWRFDATRKKLSREKDDATIESEHTLLEEIAKYPDVAKDILKRAKVEIPKLYYDNSQYHQTHYASHQAYIEELQAMANEPGVPVGYGSYGVTEANYNLSIGERSAIMQVVEMLKQHNELHATAMNEIKPEEEGYYPEYKSGWRQTILLGVAQELGVYDGDSLYFSELSIKGCPVYELYLKGHPLNHHGPSIASETVDMNKIVDSSINAAIDNLRMFGNHSVLAESSIIEHDDFEWGNDPSEPKVMPDGALREGRIQILEGREIPASFFNLIQLGLGTSQEIAGVHDILQGKSASNVRSASQVQSMASMNKDLLGYYLERLTLPLSKMAMGQFKAMLALPPDDMFVKPVTDGELIDVNWELLRKVDFIIEVKIVPSGLTATEERMQMLDLALQRLTPMFQQFGLPGAFGILDMTVLLLKDRLPDIKEVVNGIKQALVQQQQQMMAAQQQAQMMGGQAQQPPPKG